MHVIGGNGRGSTGTICRVCNNRTCVVSQLPTLLSGWQSFYTGHHAGESSVSHGSQVICWESVQVHNPGGTEYVVLTGRKCHGCRGHQRAQKRRVQGVWVHYHERAERGRQGHQHV